MSTTLFVNEISDLSIFARPVAGGNPTDMEWVLKVNAINTKTDQVEVQFFVLDGNYTQLATQNRAVGEYLPVMIEALAGAQSNGNMQGATSDLMSPYQFGGNEQSPVPYVVIEDITMGRKLADLPPNVYPMSEMNLVINIEESGTAGEYIHSVWAILNNSAGA